jgi:hypothetical protein
MKDEMNAQEFFEVFCSGEINENDLTLQGLCPAAEAPQMG